MSQNKDQEKTEEPTAQKLKKAREKGNVPQSTEISSVVLMIITAVTIVNFGGQIYNGFERLFKTFFRNSGQALANQDNALQYMEIAASQGFEIMSPLLIGLVVMAVLANVVQTGIVFAPKKMEVKFSKINPQKGLEKIFSMRGIVEGVKGFSKIFIIGTIIYITIMNEIDSLSSFLILPIHDILSISGEYTFTLIIRILSALTILSIMDAAYTRFQHRKDLRMTKQEVKDEFKQMEGDPQMKSRRKQQAKEMLGKKRLDHAVLASEVVVTNPTHYAVALQYDPEHNDAPIIRAKGMRKRALKIREFAQHYEIPVIENPPVARALYASAEEDEIVPPELYQAVAEILAYVYKLKRKKTA